MQNEVAGKTRYSVTFSRIYRDAEGQWKTTQSFGRNDLQVLAKVADRAHSRIFELQRTEDESGQAALNRSALAAGSTRRQGPTSYVARRWPGTASEVFVKEQYGPYPA